MFLYSVFISFGKDNIFQLWLQKEADKWRFFEDESF
jgi:hypothetical protein